MKHITKLSAVSLVISSLFVANAGAAHQGEYHERPLDSFLSHTKGHRAQSPSRLVSVTTMQKVLRVHACEWPFNWSGNSSYPDGIGMTLANWLQFRPAWFPANPSTATPQEQGWVLSHFLGYYHMPWPHQSYPAYCGPGY